MPIRSLMLQTVLVCSIATFFASFFFHKLGMRLAQRWKLVAVPDARRRHDRITPVIGGICIFTAWSLGIILFSCLNPSWVQEQWQTLVPVALSLVILVTLGVMDDIKGLNPAPKLVFQSLAVAIVLVFEPKVHNLCSYWSSVLKFPVWPLAVVWIMGITNAINLVDGLDGLAGGTSFLVSSSILVLSIWTGNSAAFSTVAISLVLPALLAFLYFNWNPARLFLGDNGSLPLGFLIAITSLMCRRQNHSWVMIASVVVMMGYPILDMGMVVARRFFNGLALFKGDRNHLHFRVQRLGLSVRQTAVLLLSITFYLQITALAMARMDAFYAAICIPLALFSIGTLLWIVFCTERSKVLRLGQSAFKLVEARPPLVGTQKPFTVLNIGLTSLLEASLFEEKRRYKQIVRSLEAVLRASLRPEDELIMSSEKVMIILYGVDEDKEVRSQIKKRFEKKLEMFSSLIDLQCSLSSMPVTFCREVSRPVSRVAQVSPVDQKVG